MQTHTPTHPLTYTHLCLTAGVFLALITASSRAATIVENFSIYNAEKPAPFRPSAWNMNMTSAPGGINPRTPCLWFNCEWEAKPWAGVTFKPKKSESFTITREWIEKGFIRLYINVTTDQYGNIGGGDSYQILPSSGTKKIKYQEVRSQFIDQGRGIDEITSTWQEILIPLSYFTELRPGDSISGLSFQTRHQAVRTFSLDEIGYVRYDTLPEWIEDQLNEEVIQEWVTWPAYDDLPEVVKADRRPISIHDGRFAYPDGSRAFLINPYCREDPRAAYGNHKPDRLPPTYNLYNRDKHGWIYDETPATEILCRLGFNSFSATPVPTAWWHSIGYNKNYNGGDDNFLKETLSKRITLPFYVDLVSWPYTMGAPASNTAECNLPDSAVTIGYNHWTQYRTIGEGRNTWLKMWSVNALRYRDSGAKALIVELMNEPAYMAESPDHYKEFEQWLKQRYGSVEKLNTTWHTDYKSLEDASVFVQNTNGKEHGAKSMEKRVPADGQRLDYDEYLAETFESLISEGVKCVNRSLPESLIGVQTMSGFMSTPHDSIWKYRLAGIESVVLTPTGGGSWTKGSAAPGITPELTNHPMAGAPIENDLLLAAAGNKMIVDNETYLRGQTRLATRNRLWEHVACGLDGLTIFAWSKRGWVWWKDRAAVQTDADKYPYSSLIPIARRTDALRGILDFSIEVQTLAPQILPKPWGPEPSIGFLYSWDNARRRLVGDKIYNRLPDYYTAMRYSHWNMTMLTADKVLEKGIPGSIKVIVTGGITHVEPGLSDVIRKFTERGGILILGESDFTADVYNNLLPETYRLAPVTIFGIDNNTSTIKLKNSESLFPGGITAVGIQKTMLKDGAKTVLENSEGKPVITKHAIGQGTVYHQSADVIGYSLAGILHEILYDAADGKIPDNWRSVKITEKGRHAPNILVSRRSYPDYQAFILLNRDNYDRFIRFSIPGLAGEWTIRGALTKTEEVPMQPDGIEISLPASGPAVFLLKKK